MSRHPDNERWVTPPEVFDPLMAEFDFDLDAAADRQTTRLPLYLGESLETDLEWPGDRVWLNPPYGRKLEPFVRRAAQEASLFDKLVVALIPLRGRGAWWHECVIGLASEVRCVRKRVKFMRPDGTRGKFTMSCDSCIVVWWPKRHDTRLTSWLQEPSPTR
jgi:phage N-6-adenine-methyltransferase